MTRPVEDPTSWRRRLQARRLGIPPYEALNVTYVDLADPGTVDLERSDARVILPEEYYDFPFDLAGQRVAIVSNGVVKACGREIDDHDVVVRITSLRNWRRDAVNDGERLSLWAGQPWRVAEWGPAGEIHVLDGFVRAAREGLRLWALSPFHISFVAYRWMRDHGALRNLIVAPTPAVIYDIACEFMSAADLTLLFSIPADRPGVAGRPGGGELLRRRTVRDVRHRAPTRRICVGRVPGHAVRRRDDHRHRLRLGPQADGAPGIPTRTSAHGS